MSVQAITWALKVRVRSATHKAVLLVLANRMDPTGFGWPSQKLTAKEAQCSDRTVRRVLLDLEADGVLIRADRRRQNGSYTTDTIQFAMPLEPADNLTTGGPADNLTSGQSDQRSDTTAPADNLSGLTSLEPNTKKPKIEAAKKPPPNLPEVIESYNEAAERRNWVRLSEFTEKRRMDARRAWKRVGGLEGWRRLLAEAETQSFLGGASDRGWRMNFDFFVSDRGITAILEGKYRLPSEQPAQVSEAERARRLANWNHDRTWHPSWGSPPDEGAKP